MKLGRASLFTASDRSNKLKQNNATGKKGSAFAFPAFLPVIPVKTESKNKIHIVLNGRRQEFVLPRPRFKKKKKLPKTIFANILIKGNALNRGSHYPGDRCLKIIHMTTDQSKLRVTKSFLFYDQRDSRLYPS